MSFLIPQKTPPKQSSVFSLTLVLLIQISSSFHWDGNILYDLETNTRTDFTIETADWILSNYETPGLKFYDCSNSFVMGGYAVLGGTGLAKPAPTTQYFQRTYSSLPTHNQIYLQMRFFQIDSWDLGDDDHFDIDIDGTPISGWGLNLNYPGAIPLCAVPDYPDFIFTISLAYPHSASSLTLKMISVTNEDTLNESFGFRDIKIEFLSNTSPYFSLCAPGVPSSYLSDSRCQVSCTTAGNSITPVNYGFCFPSSCSNNCQRCSGTSTTCTSCPTGSFLIGTTCYPTCDPPLTTKLLGGISYCETPCLGQYVWWDGSCSSSCSYTTSYGSYAVVAKTVNIFQECIYPCPPNEFLYLNTSCLNSCPSPLRTTVYKDRNFCEYSCTSSQYLAWNGSCLSTCPSPLMSEIQGISPQQKFCWFPCSGTQYLYWNGSCSSTCPSPFISETQGTTQPRNFCWYPCAETEYLYWNGSCLNACPSPLSPETQGTSQQRNLCWFPCAETQYLYWNGSCIGACPYPLSPETQQGSSSSRKFCWYPCAETEYLYWNGSCINSCPSPLSPEIQGITQQRNFCWYTCDVSEHLYWNQSCGSHCPIPLVSFDLSNNLFCFLPCDMPNIYWYQDLSCRKECNFPYVLLYRDSVYQCLKPCSRLSEYFYDLEKECHGTCEPPYSRQIINTVKVCHINASTLASETNKIKPTAQAIKTLGKVTSAMIKVASISQLSTPRSTLLIQLSAIMQYIRYMRINYPWRVQLLFQSNDPGLISLSFDFNIPNKIQDKFDNYPLPDVFEKYNLDSNFISNMWDLLNTALLVLLAIFVLLLLKPIVKKNYKANHIKIRILQSLRWNIPIAMIFGGAGEIIFFASLQIRNTPLDSAISIVSFLISILMIFWIIAILAICLRILRGFHQQRQKITPSSSENQNWLHKWKGYEILYEEIEKKSLFSLAYMVIYVIRAILFFAIIANFYDYPLTQSILINVMNFLIFIYLLSYKPLKDLWNTIQLLLNEILGNIITICVLTLAIMDKAEIEAQDSRVTIGNIIIAIILIFYILGVVFIIIEGVLFLIQAYKTWKEMRARGIKNPFKMIQILLFGEAKTHPEEVPLELSQNSSRMDTTSLQTKRNDPQKLENKQNIDGGRNSILNSDIPLDSSSRFFLPTRRVNPTEIQLSESDIQNTEYRIETSQANRSLRRPNHSLMGQNETLTNERNPNENISGLILSTSFEPTLQPSTDFIQGWGNLKARMKRFNQSIHKIHWSHEE